MLRLAEIEDGDIKLTPLGHRFVDMDVDQRKKSFGDQVLAHISLASHIKRVLDERRPIARPRDPLPGGTRGLHVRRLCRADLEAW